MEEKTIVDVALEWVKRQNTEPVTMCLPIKVIELIDREGRYVLIRELSRKTGLTVGFTLYELREEDYFSLVHYWNAEYITLALTAFAVFVYEDPLHFDSSPYEIQYDDEFKEVTK
mgnify:CR=1 FL=1